MTVHHACAAGIEKKVAPRIGQTITIKSPLRRPSRTAAIASAIRMVHRIATSSGGSTRAIRDRDERWARSPSPSSILWIA